MPLIAHLSNRKGVTLTEILIGTVILGLVAGFAAHNVLRPLPTHRLNSATRQVVWDLRAARMRAINQSQNVIVAFTSDHEYATGSDLNNNGVLDDGEGRTTDLQAQYHQITFAAPLPSPLTFSPKGLSKSSPINNLTNASAAKQITVTFVGYVGID